MRYNNIKNMSNNEFKRLADRFICEFLSRINSGKLEKMELINSDAVRLSTDNITDDVITRMSTIIYPNENYCVIYMHGIKLSDDVLASFRPKYEELVVNKLHIQQEEINEILERIGK